MRGKGWKPLGVAVAVFLCVLLVGVCMLSHYGLAFFNVLFGKPVYTVNIFYRAFPSYGHGGVESVRFDFNISLARERAAVEAVGLGCMVYEYTGDNVALDLNIHVLVYVLNRAKLFERTFSFDDLNPRLLKVYLQGLPEEAKMVYVEIDGYYMVNGEHVSIGSYGGAYGVER